jgi:hypothetical protein
MKPQDILPQLKDLGGVLATLSACGYVTGYLAMRARARALGLSPAFKLVDEAYVFAGFRVFFITLIVLLLSAPLLLAARPALHWLASRAPAGALPGVRCLALSVVLAWTLFNLRILGTSAVLVKPAQGAAALERAVLDGSGSVALIIWATLLPVVSGLWLWQRITVSQGPFEWLLGLALGIQLCSLPIYHGALFADRAVRVLASRPEGLDFLEEPVAIVDQTGKQATLLGVDREGTLALITMAQDDLKRVHVRRVVALPDLLGELRSRVGAQPRAAFVEHSASTVHLTDGAASTSARSAMKNNSGSKSVSIKNNATFLELVVEQLRLTFEAIGSLNETPLVEGQLWEARIDAEGRVRSRRRIGTDSSLAWPVSPPGGDKIWALQAGHLVSVAADGSIAKPADDTRWCKLLGATSAGQVLGFVAAKPQAVPAIFTPPAGLVRGVPEDDGESAEKLAVLRQDTRSYAGQTRLSVARSERGGRGFDVYLSGPSGRSNVSDCGDDSCGQASLASEPDRVLYVRAPRY